MENKDYKKRINDVGRELCVLAEKTRRLAAVFRDFKADPTDSDSITENDKIVDVIHNLLISSVAKRLELGTILEEIKIEND